MVRVVVVLLLPLLLQRVRPLLLGGAPVLLVRIAQEVGYGGRVGRHVQRASRQDIAKLLRVHVDLHLGSRLGPGGEHRGVREAGGTGGGVCACAMGRWRAEGAGAGARQSAEGVFAHHVASKVTHAHVDLERHHLQRGGGVWVAP